MNDSERVKNVEIAFDLIEYLADGERKVGVREASRIFDVPKSTMQRIFNSLVYKGIVLMDKETDQYQLSYKIAKFASRFMFSNDLVTISSSVLRKLQEETGETVCLYVRVDHQITPILQYESQKDLRVTLKAGKPYPLNTGACGKLTSAYMIDTQEELNELLPYFSKLTEHSVVDPNDFMKELEIIKKQGYAISNSEMLEGVVALAVPILSEDQLVASIGLYGPSVRLHRDLIDIYIEKLIGAQKEITSKLSLMSLNK